MADVDKEKAEKLAAARKRVEQLKKQKEKGKKTGKESEKRKDTSKSTVKEAAAKPEEAKKEPVDAAPVTAEPETIENEAEIDDKVDSLEKSEEEKAPSLEDGEPRSQSPPEQDTPPRQSHGRQPSLSIQSKLRSSSFRQASGGMPVSPSGGGSSSLAPLSPDGNAMGEIYRKQAVRLDELERENKRLNKDLEASENRWRKAEEELEELRSSSAQIAEFKSRAEKAEAKSEEINKLNLEIQSLTRQNAHLQSLTSIRPRDRQGSISLPPPSPSSPIPSDLHAQLASKSAAIENMEMVISNLHAQLSSSSTTSTSASEQISALEEKIERAERAAGSAQRELLDARKNLDRASEKAVREGTERTSARVRIGELEREVAEHSKNAEESGRKAEMLDKKLGALTNLHKEADARRREGEREVGEMRKRVVGLENENGRIRGELERLRKQTAGHRKEGENEKEEGLEELEDEERGRLEGRVRELEGELYEARRGNWKDGRREMQGGMEGSGEDGMGMGSPGGGFDEVDLSGGAAAGRRQSFRGTPSKGGRGASSFANVLQSGFSAFTGGNAAGPGVGTGAQRGSLELMDDDDMAFDENAFRAAQEDEALRRLERVKDIKRGLKDWEGYRLDIVDLRMSGGGGVGEIFDI